MANMVVAIRHTFASRALALGEGLPIIGRLLGHRQAETTARYAHLDRNAVGKSAERVASPQKPALRRRRLLSPVASDQGLLAAQEALGEPREPTTRGWVLGTFFPHRSMGSR